MMVVCIFFFPSYCHFLEVECCPRITSFIKGLLCAHVKVLMILEIILTLTK